MAESHCRPQSRGCRFRLQRTFSRAAASPTDQVRVCSARVDSPSDGFVVPGVREWYADIKKVVQDDIQFLGQRGDSGGQNQGPAPEEYQEAEAVLDLPF